MKKLTDLEVGAVSGGLWDPSATGFRLYGSGFYDTSSNYVMDLGAGYSWNIGGINNIDFSVKNNYFTSSGNLFDPVFGLGVTFRY